MIETISRRTSVFSYLKILSDEIGLITLLKSGTDVYLIILLRMIRLFGFGGTSVILVLYLRELKFKEQFIGVFMTITFIGDLITSFSLSVAADVIGRKKVLILSSIAMTITGLAFSLYENPYLLTVVAAIGILTPTGGEVGPFRSVEQSSIASLAPYEHRSDVYAWYTFLGSFCAAFGSIACGTLVDYTNETLGYSLVDSYRIAFFGYTVVSSITVVLSFLISNKVEWTTEVQQSASNEGGDNQDETTQLLASRQEEEQNKKSKFKIFPTLHKSTYAIVLKLSLLFALDSFASSLAPISWQSYYIKQKFNASASYLGSVFFTTGIISGFTSLLGTSLTKRLGPVVTMVVTHLPASILLALVPLPNSLGLTMAILVIRASTQTMDVAPKHVFLATLVPPSDRTSVFGWVNVVKTLAQVIGPTVVGIFSHNGIQWLAFIIAGSLKATYDLGILATFISFNRHKQH